MTIPDNCGRCGTGIEDYALVEYEPNPNDAQAESEWGSDLPEMTAIVCMECSRIIAVFDPDGLEDGDSSGSDYKVERELR